MRLKRWEPLTVSHDPTILGADRHCASGDTKGLVYHVLLQEHLRSKHHVTF